MAVKCIKVIHLFNVMFILSSNNICVHLFNVIFILSSNTNCVHLYNVYTK